MKVALIHPTNGTQMAAVIREHGIEAEAVTEATTRPTCQFLVYCYPSPDLEAAVRFLARTRPLLAEGTELWVCTSGTLDRRLLLDSGATRVLQAPNAEPPVMLQRVLAELALFLPEQDTRFGDMIGFSLEMRTLFDRIKRFAPMDKPALILGDHGSGKGMAAKALHQHSGRQGSLTKINSAAFSEGMLESELFGHVKGAFTGAETERIGLMAAAGRGSFFLDEIGDLPLHLQAKLLSVTEDHEIRRVGANHMEPLHARMIFATNRDLAKAMAEGGFRRDLYDRLNYFTLHMPSLHSRPVDILLIARHFLHVFNAANQTDLKLNTTCADQLFAHPWPGNVRELESVIERTAVFSDGAYLSSIALREALQEDPVAVEPKEAGMQVSPMEQTYAEAQEMLKETYFYKLMRDCLGDKKLALEKSGLSKARFYEIIKALDLSS